MNGHMPVNPQMIGYTIGGLLLAAIIGLRLLTAGKAQRMNMGALLIRPVILVVAAISLVALAPPTDPKTIGIMLVCLGAGSAIGWWRGKFVHITVDPETHALTSVTPIFAVLLLVALLVARIAVKLLFFPTMDPTSPASMQLNAEFVLFGVGALGVTSLEMWTRAKRLLAQAKGAAA